MPAGQRIYAIGDIHGRLDLLEKLLEEIRRDDSTRAKADTLLIFLGDLVDRGPHSFGVIERLIKLRDEGVEAKFLLGNHDEVFLKAATGNEKAIRMLSRIGGRETILSYGVDPEEYQSCDFDELAALLARKVPETHIEFLSSFDDYAEVGDYLFVHAGVRPGIAIAEQSLADLRWIRHEFLGSRVDHDKMVIHGHSISDDVDVCSNRIGIDTGAFASGRLTAIGLEGSDRWFLAATGPSDPRWERLSD
jgi:serine/threonine protein phosphatase 1